MTHTLNMDMHERLRTARIDAGYETAAEAARAFGWSQYTVASNENGNRAFGRKAAERYAAAYHVGLEWLLTGKGDAKGKPNAEIVDIWSRIPERWRGNARKALEAFTEDDEKDSA